MSIITHYKRSFFHKGPILSYSIWREICCNVFTSSWAVFTPSLNIIVWTLWSVCWKVCVNAETGKNHYLALEFVVVERLRLGIISWFLSLKIGTLNFCSPLSFPFSNTCALHLLTQLYSTVALAFKLITTNFSASMILHSSSPHRRS